MKYKSGDKLIYLGKIDNAFYSIPITHIPKQGQICTFSRYNTTDNEYIYVNNETFHELATQFKLFNKKNKLPKWF